MQTRTEPRSNGSPRRPAPAAPMLATRGLLLRRYGLSRYEFEKILAAGLLPTPTLHLSTKDSGRRWLVAQTDAAIDALRTKGGGHV